MILERFVNGRARSNAYLYADGAECLVVDPGVGGAPKILKRLEALSLSPQAIILTHGHPDHVWTARALAERLEVPTYLHEADWRWFEDPATGGYVPVVSLGGRLLTRLKRLRPGALRSTGELAGVRVLHTPGHTEGSVAFLLGDVCFVGDTVFRRGIGHSIYPGGNGPALRASIRRELASLGDDVRLFPGHGVDTTVGAERERWEETWTS